jgi:GNAT superfamily N-acetyltransferase
MGHLNVSGLAISIENPDGSERKWTNSTGETGVNVMKGHYGYIKRADGADGDKLDALVKTGTPEDFDGTAFVIHQNDPKTGAFDEHKVYIGFDSAEEAKAAYLSNYQKGWKGFGSIEEIPMADLASGVKAGALKGGKGQQSPQSSALDAAKKAVANAQVDAPEREMTRQNLTGGALIAAAEQQGQAAVDKLTGDAKAKGAAALKALLSKLRDYNGKVSLDLGSGKGGTYQLKPGDQGWKNATLVVNPAEIVALTANDAVSTKHATKMVQLLFRHEVIHAKVVTKITVKKAQEIWLALSDEARAAVTTAYSVRLVASGMKPESFIGKDFHATNEYIRALVEIALQGPTSERIISVDLANKPMGKDLVKKWKDFLAEVLTILKDLKRQFSEVKSPEVRDRLIADVDALVKQVADEIRNLEKSIGPGAESAQTPNTEAESTSGKPAGGSSPTVAPQESIKSANESSDDALRQEWWDKSLTTAGRASILKTAGFTKANPKAFWRNLPENVRSGIDYRRPSEFRQVNRQRTDLDSPTVKIGDWISDSRGSMGPVISFEGETPVMGMEGENEGDVDPEAAVGGWKLEKSPFGDQKPAPAVAKPTAEAPKAQDSAENAVPPAKAPAKTKAPTNVQPPVKPVPGAESSAIAKDDPLYPYKFEGWASTNEGGRLAVEAGGNTAKQAADNAMRLLSDRWHAREARHAAKKQLPAKDAIDDALGAAFEGLSAPPQPEYAAFEAQLESQQTLDLEDDQVSIPQFNAKKDSLIVSPLIDGVHLMVRNRDAVADFGPHEFFFNDNNDNVLGFARLTKSPKEVSINLIYVDPDRQGQGIGSAFYKYWLNQGIAVKSDKEITDATAELYKSLVRQGYGYAIKGNRAVLTPNASLSANPQPVEQVAFPKDRREVMMKAASTVIDLGLKTPQELAARLDKLRPDGALRKYARAFWRVMTGFDESLEESPDWNAVFAGIDQPAPAPSAKEPTGLISDAESARLDALNEENAQRFTKLSSNQLSQLAIELGVRPMVFQRKGIEQGEALDKTHPDDLKAALDVVTKSKAKADTPASAEANIPAKEVTTPEKTKEKKPADTKALRAMKTYLLEKLNDAIAEAPDKFSADFDRDSRVVIEVPGDGTFTLVNGKQNLQEFAKKAKSFPTTTPGSTSAKLTTPRPTGIPALGTGKPSRADQIKAAALVASTDSTRIVLNNVLDFGNELVATNGRALIRIPIEGKGTAEDPVLYTAKGGEIGPQSKHEKDFGKYPNYKAVIPQGLPVIHEGLDTGRLWQVLNQARAVFRDVNFSSNQGFERPTPFVQVLLNPDGSVGVVGEVANQYVFSVPNAPDGSQNMAADVRSNLDTYEHNRQDGAQLIGRFDADYLMESLQAMRALGHEKVKLARDLEQANETAPMMIFGDKAEVVIMSAKPEVAKPEQQPDTQPNDSDSSPNLEPGGENAGVTDSSGETGIQPQPGPTGRDGDAMDATGEGSPDARESGTVPADVPAALGGDTGAAIIREPDTGPTELLPGDFDPRGSLNPDVVGVEVEQRGSNDVAESLGGTIGVAQSLGTGSETRFPEIKASAPALTEDQAGDVAFVEKRLATKPGALLTNGTGTGKTFSGLGVVKRMLDAGKQHILIVAPSDKVVNDWIATAKEFFDIQDVGQLESIQDNGTSNRVVVTTYANMGQNPLLVNRPWDAVVTDEAHYLSQSKDGNRTNALDSIRALTLHRSGAFRYADMALPQDAERLAVIMAMSYRAREQFADEADAIRARLEAKRREYEARYKATAEADRPKVVMLSATPFAYHFSLDYAEGYLFDFPPENTKTVGRYNHASPRSQFYMENFGYRMRTGKLTAPENATATGILERRFAEKLMREGAMSGRALQVEQDYGRHFVLTESELGTKVDEIVAAIRDNDYLRPLGKYIGLGDYLERRYLLEALKARESVERIKQHLALGRKVVVFHDYKKGGASNPLNIEFPQGMEVSTTINGQNVNVKLADALAALKRAVPHFDDTARQLNGLLSPLQLLEREFSGIGIFNGDVPAKQRRAVVDTFNKSGSAMNVVLVQRASGKEGISLHDRDGKHQRVFIDLGIPGRPTDAIQSEGRIYRHGVMSNAIVEYLTTGTSFERHTFAQTIAQRASTAENLAMGERARALLQSFATGYMDAETMEPGPQQGTGGKAKDAAQQNADPFKDALALYYTNAKKTSRNKSAEGIDYFATPEPLGFKMVEWAGIRPGEKVLEPSAGHGAIARFFPDSTNRHAVEPSNELAGRLALNATDIQIHEESFEDYHIGNKFDAIVMNPPFGTAGKTAMDHVIKATKHLRNGGRIVALIPEGSSMEKRFDKWMESEDAAGIYMVAEYGMPPVTFERAGTSVKARVVVLDKTDDPTGIRSRGRRDFAGENVKDFFDAIKESSAPDRATVARLEKPEQTAETEAAPMTRDTVFPKASVAEPNTFQPADAWHAKKGKPTYVAKISRHLSNDEYAAAKATATKFSGYYSKYDKAGAIPGFQFDTAEDRDGFLAKMMPTGEALSANPTDPGNIRNARAVPYRGAKKGDVLRPYLENMNNRARAGAIIRSFERDWAPFFTYMDDLASREKRKAALTKILNKFAMGDSAESRSLWRWYSELDPAEYELLFEDSERVKEAKELLPYLENLTLSANPQPNNDAEYMAAVESGDVAKQQAMVDAAAKVAGYDSDSPFYFGAREKGLKVTEIGDSIFVTDDLDAAKDYADSENEPQSFYLAGKIAEIEDLDIDWSASRWSAYHLEDGDNYSDLDLGYLLSNKKHRRTIAYELRKAGFAALHFSGDVSSYNQIEHDSWLVADSSQIKSADPITRDEQGNVIPLSQRFNPASDSILYANPQPRSQSITDMAAKAAAIVKGEQAPEVLQSIRRGLLTLAEVNKDERLAMKGKGAAVFFQPAAKAAPFGTLELRNAFQKAASGKSSAVLSIREVFNAAKERNPGLNAPAFMAQVKADYYAGLVGLEPPEQASTVEAAGPFKLRDSMGIESTSMSFLPTTEAEMIDAAERDERTPDDILQDWASTPLQSNPQPAIDPVTEGDTPTTESNRANPGDSPLNRRAAANSRAKYEAEEMTQVDFDELRKKVAEELERDEQANLDDILYKLSDIETNGGGLSIEDQEKVRQLANILSYRGRIEGDRMLREQADKLWIANASIGSELARGMGLRRDQFKTPQERLDDAMGNILAPSQEMIRKRTINVKTKKERDTIIAKIIEENDAKISKILARNGLDQSDLSLSVDDRHAMQVALMELPQVKRYLASLPNEQFRNAVTMSMRGYDDDAIARQTGLSAEAIERTTETFRNEVAKPAISNEIKVGKQTFGGFIDAGKNAIKWVLEKVSLKANPTPAQQAAAAANAALQNQVLRILNATIPTKKQRNKRLLHPVRVGGTSNKPITIYVPYNPADWEQVYRMARELSMRDATGFDKTYEWWINGILSGPQTHVVNTASNLLSTAWHYGPQWFASATVNSLVRDPKSTQWGEFRHLWAGFMKGIEPAMTNFKQAWKTEADTLGHQYLNQPITAIFQNGQLDKLGNRGPAIMGGKGRVIRIPGRFLVAMDAFAKTLIMHAEVAAYAFRLGKQQKLHGAALTSFIEGEVKKHGSESWEAAYETATELTFQDENEITKGIEKIVNAGKMNKVTGLLFKFLFPFVRTPTNIYRSGIRKAGGSAGVMMWRLAKGGFYRMTEGTPVFENYTKAQRVKDVSESIMAGIIWMGLMSFGAGEGDEDDEKSWLTITGSRPYGVANAGERASQLRQEGGSNLIIIRLFGKVFRIPYGRYEPMALTVGTLTDAVREFKEMSRMAPADQGNDKLAGEIMKHIVAQAQDKTFLQGISAMSQLIEDIATNRLEIGASFAKQFVNGVIPNFIRQPLRLSPEIMPDAKKANEVFGSKTLGAALADAEPKINEAGMPVRRTASGLVSTLFPVATEPSTALFDSFLKSWNTKKPSEMWNPDTMTKGDWFVYDPAKGSKEGKFPLTTSKAITRFESMVGTSFASKAAQELIKLGYRQGGTPTPAMLEAVQKARRDAITSTRKLPPSIFLK